MQYSLENQQSLTSDIRGGKKRAFEFLYENLYEQLCFYVMNLCDDSKLTEDIVQDAFMKLWTDRKNIRIESSIKNYLFKSCYNLFIDHSRKNIMHDRKMADIHNHIVLQLMDNPEELEKREQKLNKALDKLPPKCKQVVKMNKIHRLTQSEIAQQLGISIKTVEKHISNGLATLRKELKQS